MTGKQPDAEAPEEDLWRPPRKNPLQKVGLVVLMIALGVVPGLALMATDPLGTQSEVPPESPHLIADPSASPLPPDDAPAQVPSPADAEAPLPSAPEAEAPGGKNLVDDPEDIGPGQAGPTTEPVEPAERRCLLILCVG